MTDPDQISKPAHSAIEEESSSAELKYKGVRKRKWGKWVSEIRLPNSRERIWLGSYDKPEKAARAFDAAQFCLRGAHANFNFPDSPPDIVGGHGFSAQEIQAAAAKFANDLDVERTGPPASSNDPEPDCEGFEPARLDGGDRPVFDGFDAFDNGFSLDFGIYSGLESLMGRNEPVYSSSMLQEMEEDEELLNGHQSHFLWNFDNY